MNLKNKVEQKEAPKNKKIRTTKPIEEVRSKGRKSNQEKHQQINEQK